METTIRVRDLTDTERGIWRRHRVTSCGELCDFCRTGEPTYWWELEAGAVDTAQGLVVTPDRMFACVACRLEMDDTTGRSVEDAMWEAMGLSDGADRISWVKVCLWAAFLQRRISAVHPITSRLP